MIGGLGNDAYVVDNVGDQAIETEPAGGIDIVRSSVQLHARRASREPRS